MSVPTYTSTGSKSTNSAKLKKSIFSADTKQHVALKQAYTAYLSNGRQNLAQTKNRGDVRGGGRKPWRQKGTGRARFGSSRNPIWRGGGVAFGPTGSENYTKKLTTQTKHTALRQALTLQSEYIIVIDAFKPKDYKTAATAKLLEKIGANGSVLLVVANKHDGVLRATNNIPSIQLVQANYLNVYDLLNADSIVIESKALELINEWLGGSNE